MKGKTSIILQFQSLNTFQYWMIFLATWTATIKATFSINIVGAGSRVAWVAWVVWITWVVWVAWVAWVA